MELGQRSRWLCRRVGRSWIMPRLATRLGYRRLFVFDSPALYGDVWVALARVAESVPDIELATGVAVSSLRHPMVTASALASIEELAPGRISAYFGTGFTARMAMGKRSVRWADLATYFRQVRSLLNGETVEIDGAPCQMIHSPGFAPPRPINVTLGLAPVGPKGFQVAQELADSVILAAPPGPDQRQWGNITRSWPREPCSTPAKITAARERSSRSVRSTPQGFTRISNGLRQCCLRCRRGGLVGSDRRRASAE